MKIEALHYDPCSMSLYAVRNDGVRLRLKKNPPVYVVDRPDGKNLYYDYNPVAAVNQWLGF